jgi:hypothetical protein
VISRSREDGPVNSAAEAQANQSEPSEPMAQLGVAPGGSEATANNATDTGQ